MCHRWKGTLGTGILGFAIAMLASGCQPFANSPRANLTPLQKAQLAEPAVRIRRTRQINAPRQAVWDVLADYGNVQAFVPSIKHSEHISGPPRGVGAVRKCTVAMNMTVTEDVAVWEEGTEMIINMHSAMPVKNHQAKFRLRDVGSDQTDVTFVMDYDFKAGVVGRAMNAVMVERMMKSSMEELLDGLERKSKISAGDVADFKRLESPEY